MLGEGVRLKARDLVIPGASARTASTPLCSALTSILASCRCAACSQRRTRRTASSAPRPVSLQPAVAFRWSNVWGQRSSSCRRERRLATWARTWPPCKQRHANSAVAPLVPDRAAAYGKLVSSSPARQAFLRRFGWRDMAYWFLWRFPSCARVSFRPQYERQAWCGGEEGKRR